MRLATYNVDNLFSRARALNQNTWEEGKPILEAYGKLSALLEEGSYTDAIKSDILAQLDALGLIDKDETQFAILRRNRGDLLRRPQSGPTQVVANGRDDWVGWVELKTEAVNGVSTSMIARVIKDVNAEILAGVEAEDRIALKRLNEQLLEPIQASYRGVMLIDGNDDRGIDVGIMTKRGCEVKSIVSHVDDMEGDERIFSRDCPEYTVRIAPGVSILVLVNHLKSKGYGSQSDNDRKRKAQATRIHEIYEQRRAEGVDLVAVVGDFNDTPNRDPLRPLLAEPSDLRDVFQHDRFDNGGRPGTFANCAASNKIDYILLSPALYENVTGGGVERRGVWGGANGTLFPHYPEITKSAQAASDHAAVYVDLDL